MLSKCRGSILGALIGDAIGAPFENDFAKSPQLVLKKLSKIASSLKSGPKFTYTDDFAMTKALASSLIDHKKCNTTAIAQAFTEEYFTNPSRGYASKVRKVFKYLKAENYQEPFGPGARQFNGTGSYGNGGAMRIAPVAVMYRYSADDDFNTVVSNVTRITHAHADGINGAIIQAAAIRLALATNGSDFNTGVKWLNDLIDMTQRIENRNEFQQNFNSEVEKGAYTRKLQFILDNSLLQTTDLPIDIVVEALGNDITALGSVPAAVLCALCGNKEPNIRFEKSSLETSLVNSPVGRTIVHAISLGGDTDTIASMAAAISVVGAWHGTDGFPAEWVELCESHQLAVELGSKLYLGESESG